MTDRDVLKALCSMTVFRTFLNWYYNKPQHFLILLKKKWKKAARFLYMEVNIFIYPENAVRNYRQAYLPINLYKATRYLIFVLLQRLR